VSAIPFVDLALRGDELKEVDEAIGTVLRRGWFILGPEVEQFEHQLALTTGSRRAVGVGSGTDALILGLRSMGIGSGDEVIVPNMTAFPTAAAVIEAGATPVLVDVERDRPLLDLDATLAALTSRTAAVILVHLYGIVADAERFAAELSTRGVPLVEDCAQAQGARLASGSAVGTAGRFGALSFYPTKNLAAVGDGGAVVTDDPALADEVMAWRSHGERGRRYRHELPARNSRLDDIQAAVLRIRVGRLPDDVAVRRQLSTLYAETLEVPYAFHGNDGAPHLAVVAVSERDALAAHLRRADIATACHYPMALSDQPALANRSRDTGGEHARRWAKRCLSLPLFARLDDAQVRRVAHAVNEWARAAGAA
jgi:dTDP-3-amino-3,4,6-trideoxy-alpha-D-glucose transaminase